MIFLENWSSLKLAAECALVSSVSFHRLISHVAAFLNLTSIWHIDKPKLSLPLTFISLAALKFALFNDVESIVSVP